MLSAADASRGFEEIIRPFLTDNELRVGDAAGGERGEDAGGRERAVGDLGIAREDAGGEGHPRPAGRRSFERGRYRRRWRSRIEFALISR